VVGWCVGNVGWKRKELLDAVHGFRGPEYVMPTYQYQRWNTLAEKLVSLMPNRNYTCFKATGGTEAVEVALKAAKAFNKREKFIAFRGAYHGQSFASMGLVRLPDHESHFGPFSKNFIQIEAKDWEATTQKTASLISEGDICAFISEPIICNLGIIIPPKSFFDEVYKACKDSGTVFISDEVATGFGRTGKWFGFEHYGLEPDIVTVAKGFSSGYGGIGAAVVKQEIAESMRFDFSNYSTFGWHPLATEATIANIDYIKKNKLVENSAESGHYLMGRLSEFCKPEGKGLCVGFQQGKKGSDMKCIEDGLLVSTLDGRFTLFPPLDVRREEIDQAVEIIRRNDV
jgi:acetylornithine/succinyldiaminopimelate/putrescine aminotransferase